MHGAWRCRGGVHKAAHSIAYHLHIEAKKALAPVVLSGLDCLGDRCRPEADGDAVDRANSEAGDRVCWHRGVECCAQISAACSGVQVTGEAQFLVDGFDYLPNDFVIRCKLSCVRAANVEIRPPGKEA